MKKIFLSLFAAALLAGCATKEKNSTASGNTDTAVTKTVTDPNVQANNPQPAAPADDANATTIQWIDPVVKDLGALKKDKSVEITYRFKNTGDKPLVIENVTAQCGCTIPEKPQQPFAPGEEGVIKATFNGVGHGTISKQVFVTANTKPVKNHTLTFTGEIK
jgi:hypothetical protein